MESSPASSPLVDPATDQKAQRALSAFAALRLSLEGLVRSSETGDIAAEKQQWQQQEHQQRQQRALSSPSPPISDGRVEKELKARLDAAERTIQRLQQRCATLETEVAAANAMAEVAPPSAALTSSTDTLAATVHAHEKTIRRLERHKERLSQRLFAAEQALEAAEAQQQRQQRQMEDAAADEEGAHAVMSPPSARVEALEAQLSVVTHQRDKLLNLQLDAVLADGNHSAAAQEKVNADVKQLFRVLRDFTAQAAQQHAAERQRWCAQLYELERRLEAAEARC